MITFDETSFNQVTFDGTDMKRIILNDKNAWAQEYQLTLVNNDASINIPQGYLYWSTRTDPASGTDHTKCHYGEVIRTRLCDDGYSRIALPTGTYTVTGNTTIPANLYRFSPVDIYYEGASDDGVIWTHTFSFRNPLSMYDSNDTFVVAPDLDNHYALYVQWAYFQNNTWTAGSGQNISGNPSGGELFSDGAVFRHQDVINSDREIRITIETGAKFATTRVTQVIEYDGVVAIRQSHAEGFDGEEAAIDDVLSSPWEANGTSSPEGWT